ncbi:MAG: ATP-binding protein [Anaerolineales bacterium]|nr:ATP-binding protein [Anaerolineales bacterium]
MFHKLQIWRYKCIQVAQVELFPINILIGPNASGKSTLLDVFAFLRDALVEDVEQAIRKRATALRELVWNQKSVSEGFAFAIESVLPEQLRWNNFERIRYELRVGLSTEGSLTVSNENLWLISERSRGKEISEKHQLYNIPSFQQVIHSSRTPPGYRLVVRKVPESNSNYYKSERSDWNFTLRFLPNILALVGLPQDEAKFKAALWFRQKLLQGVQILQLNSMQMRRPCPQDAPRTFQNDGSNLAIIVQELQKKDPKRYAWWIEHLKTVLNDLETVEVAERPEDRSLYINARFNNGLVVPAWLLSDGTLRLMALTLIAYFPANEQIFIVEEPENGIHPKAIEAVYQSLSSVYESQIFLATHSPLLLALAKPKDLLIFSKKTEKGATIMRGDDHPALKEWKVGNNIDLLFAAGILD